MASQKAIPLIVKDITVAWSVCLCARLYVCPSVTLPHLAKAVGQDEMPFGRDTRMVPTKGRFGGRNPQFAVIPPITKLHWP